MACFICGNNGAKRESPLALTLTSSTRLLSKIDCPSCGIFYITENAYDTIQDWIGKGSNKSRIAAYLARRRVHSLGPVIIVDGASTIPGQVAHPQVSIQEAIAWFPKTISERLDNALINLEKCSQLLGLHIVVRPNEDYPMLLAEDVTEIPFILQALHEKGYVKEYPGDRSGFTYTLTNIGNVALINILLTAKGLAHLDELERQNPKSNKAFVAMWFPKPEDPQKKLLDEAYEKGFYPAIKEAGYDPIRIDKEEFLGRIDDEIIANIRQSRFVVADFTGQRGGVYYEAGFGHGLGIPVIFTCSKEHVDSLHFDTRQYNHLVWTDSSDLHEKLLNRIKATIA